MAPAMNVSTTGSGSQNPFNLLGSGTGTSTGSLSGNSMSANNGGCPQLQSNCDVNCLTIGSDGCVQCTCSGRDSLQSLNFNSFAAFLSYTQKKKKQLKDIEFI